jgi:hypothetical protein
MLVDYFISTLTDLSPILTIPISPLRSVVLTIVVSEAAFAEPTIWPAVL